MGNVCVRVPGCDPGIQRFNPEGELGEASTQLTVSVKPGWKRGTKITFPGEGDEGPGVLPADVVLVVAERYGLGFGGFELICVL